MARGFSSRRGSLPAPKRQIANDGVTGLNNARMTFGAALSATVLLGAQQLAIPAATLVRTRGSLLVRVIAAGDVDDVLGGAFGLIVASNQAFAAGVASLPSPVTEIENDWVVWVPVTLNADLGSTNPLEPAAFQRVEFDSRGMRKMKLGESLVGVFEMFQSGGTTGTIIDVVSQFRLQFKL